MAEILLHQTESGKQWKVELLYLTPQSPVSTVGFTLENENYVSMKLLSRDEYAHICLSDKKCSIVRHIIGLVSAKEKIYHFYKFVPSEIPQREYLSHIVVSTTTTTTADISSYSAVPSYCSVFVSNVSALMQFGASVSENMGKLVLKIECSLAYDVPAELVIEYPNVNEVLLLKNYENFLQNHNKSVIAMHDNNTIITATPSLVKGSIVAILPLKLDGGVTILAISKFKQTACYSLFVPINN